MSTSELRGFGTYLYLNFDMSPCRMRNDVEVFRISPPRRDCRQTAAPRRLRGLPEITLRDTRFDDMAWLPMSRKCASSRRLAATFWAAFVQPGS